MKKILFLGFAISFIGASAFADFDYVSAAYCVSEVEQSVKSLELFYGDEDKGLLVAEVSLDHGMVRGAIKVKIKIDANTLKVSVGEETFTIKHWIAGSGENPPTFTLEDQKYTCLRAEW